MTFEIWGLTDAFGFGPPQRWSGYVLLALSLALFLGIVVQHRRRHGKPIILGWPLPGTLLLAGAVAQAVLVVYVASPGGLTVPGLPLGPAAQAAPLRGMAPMIYAGWLAAPAAWSAWRAGSSWGPGTPTVDAPLDLALAGRWPGGSCGPVSRRHRIGWRRPLVAAAVAGLVFGLARCLEIFAYSGGSVLQGVEVVVAQAGTVLQAAMIEGIVAGLIAEAALFIAPARWTRPARLASAPYLRSLGARMVAFFLLVGVVAAVVLLVGDWVLARTSARELVETQMAQTAVQAGGGVPFFGQSGRSYLQQAASQLEPSGGPIPLTTEGFSISIAVPSSRQRPS
jgi:hypothetical protein